MSGCKLLNYLIFYFREAGRLNLSVDRYGSDYTSRLTPSKMGQRATSTPYLSEGATKSRRTLHFDET